MNLYILLQMNKYSNAKLLWPQSKQNAHRYILHTIGIGLIGIQFTLHTYNCNIP